MAFKFVVLACLMAAANAGFVPAPLVAGPVLAKAEPYDARPQYAYGYDVQDHLTGDFKSAQESRDGDFVQGSYSVVDPDGTKRTVDYAADPLNGFNAVVRREPLVAAAPVAYAAPVAKYVAPAPAPIVAAAPLAKYVAPAPVAYAPAPVAYAAPFSKYVGAPAPVAYAAGPAPVAYAAGPAPVAYAAGPSPVAYANAPVAKVGAPVAYAASPFARYAAAPAAYPSPLARFAYPAPAYTTFA